MPQRSDRWEILSPTRTRVNVHAPFAFASRVAIIRFYMTADERSADSLVVVYQPQQARCTREGVSVRQSQREPSAKLIVTELSVEADAVSARDLLAKWRSPVKRAVVLAAVAAVESTTGVAKKREIGKLMALSVVVALLCFAASVRGDCSVAQQGFSKRRVILSGVIDQGGERVCSGGGQCCSSRDLPDLDNLAISQMSTFLGQALTFGHTTLQRSAENVDGAVCWKLKETSNKTDRLLRSTYADYYNRNRELFLDFFCNLSVIYENCDNCLETTEQVVKDFLHRLLLIVLKEQSQVSSVSEYYERCVFTHTNLESTFRASTITWLISRLQKGICTPCAVRKGLAAVALLIKAAKKPRINGNCEQSLRCMQSCSCCSNIQQCLFQPCYSCCTDTLTSCMSPDYTSLHPQFSRTIERLRLAAQDMLGNTFDPDYMLNSLSVTMSEVIMNAYTKLTDVMKKMTSECGNIRAHFVSSRIPAPAVTCPLCLGSVKTFKTAFSRMRDDLPAIQNIFKELKQRICLENAAKPTASEGCDSCAQCRNLTFFQDRPTAYQHELDVMERDLPAMFREPITEPTAGPASVDTVVIQTEPPEQSETQQTPTVEISLTQHTPAPRIGKCALVDDEDCDGSGGSGMKGSGDGSGEKTDLLYQSSPSQTPEEPTQDTTGSPVDYIVKKLGPPQENTAPKPSVLSVWKWPATAATGLPREAGLVNTRSGGAALLHGAAVLITCAWACFLMH